MKASNPRGAFLVLRSLASLEAQGLPPKPCSSWLGSTAGLSPAAPGDAGVSPGNFSPTQVLQPLETEEILKTGIVSQDVLCVHTHPFFPLPLPLHAPGFPILEHTCTSAHLGPASPQCLHSPHPPFPRKGLALYSPMPLNLLSHPRGLLPPRLPPMLRRSHIHGADPRLRISGSHTGSFWLGFNM